MENKKEYIERIYEEFANDIEPTSEMKVVYQEFSNKIENLKNSLNEEQKKELEELEEIFSNMTNLEVKQAFFKGFSIGTNLNIEK